MGVDFNCFEETINQQHEQIFNCIDNVIDAYSNKDIEAFNRYMVHLIDIFTKHVKYEERIIIEKKGKISPEHKIEHDHAMYQIANLMDLFGVKGVSENLNILNYFKEWYKSHIETKDIIELNS